MGPLINERVTYKYRDVRVIGADGAQLGILQSRQALQQAKDLGLDLVLVAAQSNPPVCRIIDYGRHKYEMEKREREGKRKQQDVKGIKISPRIAEHDLMVGVNKARRFLEAGDKVRIVCMFKAREVTHPELGRQKLENMAAQLADIGIVEKSPSLDGKQMVMVLLPKPTTGTKKNAKAEDKQDSGQEV
ncbi:MAG: translation initiation factor IF-3 [Armatimonadetes bacterium]|nr:translation initiation factor IF-3 [Armatimonadota bacterium]